MKKHFDITIAQLDDMKHAVGFRIDRIQDGKYNAFRNFFAMNEEQASWEDLVIRGLATKRKLFNETVYPVSDEGLLLLSNVLSIEIIKPEE